jgi:hypothetical protein
MKSRTRCHRVVCLAALVVAVTAHGVARAAVNEFCSEGKGNKPAKLMPVEGNADYRLVVGKENPETLVRSGSVGTGLNGSVYVGKSGDAEVMYFSELWLDANVEPEVKIQIILFRDRVFWPCK